MFLMMLYQQASGNSCVRSFTLQAWKFIGKNGTYQAPDLIIKEIEL